MSINGLDMVGSGDRGASSLQISALGKDDFLNLLVAQLKNQDPLEPMESTEFTAQLAQFTSLEQLGNINDNLEYMKFYQASLSRSQAVNFVGKTIEAAANSIPLEKGVARDIWFDLEKDAEAAFINIYDSSGVSVKTIEAGELETGKRGIKWDGTNNQGDLLADGSYSFEVLAFDPWGNGVGTSTLVSGKATGIRFSQEGDFLKVGNQEVLVSDVIRVGESYE